MRGILTCLIVTGVCAGLAVSPLCFADQPGPFVAAVQVARIATDRSDAQADALTVVLREGVASLPGWSLADGNHSFELLSIKLACPLPPDTGCLSRMAEVMGTDRIIWGTINKVNQRAVGALHLWQRDAEEREIGLNYAANLTDPYSPELKGVVRQALASLTGGKPKGPVEIRAGDFSGSVYVDGVLAGSMTNGVASINIEYGEHRIEVRSPGGISVSGSIIAYPEGTPPLVLQPETAGSEQQQDGKSSNLRRIGGYGAILAGGALALGGLYFSLSINGINHNDNYTSYRDQFVAKKANKSDVTGADAYSDVCDAASGGYDANGGKTSASDVDAWCSKASTFGVLQYVFYGLGAVSIGVGTYLLLTDSSSQEDTTTTKARLEIVPMAVQGGGGLDVRVVF